VSNNFCFPALNDKNVSNNNCEMQNSERNLPINVCFSPDFCMSQMPIDRCANIMNMKVIEKMCTSLSDQKNISVK